MGRHYLSAGALLLCAAACAVTVDAAGFTRSTPSAAPFADAWSQVPRSPQARRAKTTLVFGQEQDIDGFNTALTCCNQFWAAVQVVPVIRGAFIVDNRLRHVRDLVSSAKATKTTLSFTIRKDASWNWGGRKLPVTYADFVYTWKQLVDPRNDVVGREGYDQITGFTHQGEKRVTFTWRKPFAAWQDLFTTVYPSVALAGMDFNKIWTSCICGRDGKPVSDGPFYLANYTRGQGSTLKANRFWYGTPPSLREIDFKIITDTSSEVQAMRAGEVDAINPTFGSSLTSLKGQKDITFSLVQGLFQEHIDFQFGKQGHPLLRSSWMRQAIMQGIDRAAIIKTVYGDLAGDTKPLDNILFYPADTGYRPDFSRWNYDPAKALATLKKHCTGGPSSSDKMWTCNGLPARFRYTWTASNATRGRQEAIVKAQLKSIGIDIVDAALPANVVFGSTGIPSSNYDLANFAWVTTPDPSAFAPIWGCGGEANYLNYCNREATRLIDRAGHTLDPGTRTKLYQQADVLMAGDVPTVPLYTRPNPLIYRSSIAGMKNNPSVAGFAWNAEDWRWR